MTVALTAWPALPLMVSGEAPVPMPLAALSVIDAADEPAVSVVPPERMLPALALSVRALLLP